MNSPLVRVAGGYVPFDSIRSITFNKEKNKVEFAIWDAATNTGGMVYEEIPYGTAPSEYMTARAYQINSALKES